MRAATGLLTRVPAGRPDPADLGRAVGWFGVVGALIGIVVACVHAGITALAGPLLGAVAAVATGVMATGALHEDGLADTADALGARDRAHALEILRDPTHGTFGVLALVGSVLARVAALAVLDGWTALAVLPAAHALSRGGAVVLLGMAPARADGLGRSYADAASPGRIASAAVTALVVAGVTIGPWAVPAAGLTLIAVAGTGRLARRRFGGVAGDVMGAAQQVAEIAILVLAAAAVTQGWPPVAWWC